MFCTNDPCENESIPESGELHLCHTCLQAWQRGFRQWSTVAGQVTTYHTPNGLLIQLPRSFAEDHPPEASPFKELFKPLPSGRVPCGFLELGEWQGNEYEVQVPLLLGPDGQVWAEVGEVEALPLLVDHNRESLAGQMLDEFLEACDDDGDAGQDEGNPTRAALRTWPVPRVMHWLQLPTTLRRADPAQRRLIVGLLGELRALGFQPSP